jgi:hypothetical protein
MALSNTNAYVHTIFWYNDQVSPGDPSPGDPSPGDPSPPDPSPDDLSRDYLSPTAIRRRRSVAGDPSPIYNLG